MSQQRKRRRELNRAITLAQEKDAAAREHEDELRRLFQEMTLHSVPVLELQAKLLALAETQAEADRAWQQAAAALEQARPVLSAIALALPAALLDEAREQSNRILAELEQWTAALVAYVRLRDQLSE
jgi:hypothetical protein